MPGPSRTRTDSPGRPDEFEEGNAEEGVYGRGASRDEVVCFFQSGEKFKTRYATLGFSDKANLDKDAMWPTAFALKELTATEEAKIAKLVKQAVR
jgi:hypothetical protein